MAILRDVLRAELAILVACIVVAIVWKIQRGILRPGGPLAFRHFHGGGMAGALRLQLLAGSLVFALLYLASSLQSAGSGALPPVPEYALTLLGASQAIFLGTAVWRSLRRFVTLRNEGEK